jgi:hypothetical protein
MTPSPGRLSTPQAALTHGHGRCQALIPARAGGAAGTSPVPAANSAPPLVSFPPGARMKAPGGDFYDQWPAVPYPPMSASAIPLSLQAGTAGRPSSCRTVQVCTCGRWPGMATEFPRTHQRREIHGRRTSAPCPYTTGASCVLLWLCYPPPGAVAAMREAGH